MFYSKKMKKWWTANKKKSNDLYCVYHFFYNSKTHTKGDLTSLKWGGIGVSPKCSATEIKKRYAIEIEEHELGLRDHKPRHWIKQMMEWGPKGKVKARIIATNLSKEDAYHLEYCLRNKDTCHLSSGYVWNSKPGGEK